MAEYGLIDQKQYDEVIALYKREGYGGGLAPGDVVIGARIDHSLVGAVRLATEFEFLVLRGMYVQKEYQRQGIGLGLLGAVPSFIGERECWCIPYAHLRNFYMFAGFVERSLEAAPRFLMERLKGYKRLGRQVIIMRRPEIYPNKGVRMSNVVSWNLQLTVREGQLDALKTLMAEMVTSTRSEPGAEAYEWFLSEDGSQCHLYERYSDDAGVMAHLGNFGANFAERFFGCVEPTAFHIYGTPSDEARAVLSDFGAVFMGQIGGFAR